MDAIQALDTDRATSRKRRFVALGAAVLAIVVLLLGIGFAWSDLGGSSPVLVYYDVSRTDLPIIVTERGYLESQEQTTIRCQLESYDRNSGSSGTTIIYIIPNGTVVEAGELLVELDSAAIRDRLETETLEFESDKSARDQARARKLNQETQNETRWAEAKLALELAKLDRQMYLDEESGMFKLALEEIERQIDDTRNSMLEAQAALKLQETEKAGIEELFKLGYKGKSDLDQSRFSFMKAEAALAAAVNRLTNHEASRRQLETYERQKEILRLDGAVATAERNLEQVQVTNDSELAQVTSQVFEAEERVARQQSTIDQLKRQLEHCTIRAPHAGMVVYAHSDSGSGFGVSRIAEGVTVRTRQELLTLPDLSKMQVRTQIHEAVLDQITVGLPVTVRVDAFANRTFKGVVSEVAVVPSSGSNSSVKTYDCMVVIPELVQQLKPGMTAVCEIHVDRLREVLAVPVQAIVQIGGESWCYIATANGVKRQSVELGRNNDKFVQVVSGIEPNAQVVLNPTALIDEERRPAGSIAPDIDASEAPEVTAEDLAGLRTPAATRRRPADLTASDNMERDTDRARGRRSGRPGVGDDGWRAEDAARPRPGRLDDEEIGQENAEDHREP